jgi:hypothetical protein
MGPALEGTPADPWPVPTTRPEWERWRGELQFDGRRGPDDARREAAEDDD